ncbi:MAG: reverse transcriptase domain-containing protein, partial [Bacteroidota bacterium]
IMLPIPKDGPTSTMLDEEDILRTKGSTSKETSSRLTFSREKIPITVKGSSKTSSTKEVSMKGEVPKVSNDRKMKLENGKDLGSIEISDKGRSVRRSARNRPTIKTMFSSFHLLRTYFTNVMEIPRAKRQTPSFNLYEIATANEQQVDVYNLERIDEERESRRAADANKVVQLNTFNRKQMENFRYTKLCEAYSQDAKEDLDKMWTPVKIVGQILRRKDPQDIHIRLRILWLNGGTSWVRLDDFQTEHPDMVVNYAFDNDLTEFRSFKWTKLYKSIRDKESRSSLYSQTYEARAMVATRYDPQGKYKFGVEVPVNARHALRLDLANGNSLWKEAIAKELAEINQHQTFRFVSDNDDLSSYQLIPYHIVFDVKFYGRRKARLVCGGNFTSPPKEDTYSGVLGIGAVHLAFQLALLNGLQVCAADVGTAFLYGKTREKVYIVAGKEFGNLQGQKLIIDKGLYGLRSSAARFHEHLAARIRKLGFKPSKADADLYIREVKGSHYEMIATYVDDLLIFSKDPMALIEE